MGEYFDLIADHFGFSHPPRINRIEAHKRLSPAMLSFMKESRRLKNSRMREELHIHLMYPTVLEGIKAAQAVNQ